MEKLGIEDDEVDLELLETKVSQPEGIEPGLWQNLLDIGLTPSEAKVYLALISHGSLTAVDACKLSGVPRAKIYEILINLSTYGLCYEISGKKKKYSAVNPKEGLQRKMETVRRDLEMKEQLAIATGERLMPFFKSLESATSLVPSTIHFLSNADLTAKVYLRLLQEAKREIQVLSKAPYNISIKGSQGFVFDALARGVKVQSLGEIAECRNKDAVTSLLQNQSKGAEIRAIAALPSKLVMADDNLALITLSDSPNEFDYSKGEAVTLFSGVLIEHVPTVNLLKVAFDSLWQQATPLNDLLASFESSVS